MNHRKIVLTLGAIAALISLVSACSTGVATLEKPVAEPTQTLPAAADSAEPLTVVPTTKLPTTTPAVVPPTPTPLPTLMPPTATDTVVPPTATTTAEPATVTPTPAPLVTSGEEIFGTWRWVGARYLVSFDEEGMLRQARSLEQLESEPYAVCSYRFAGEKMIINQVSVSGVPSCGNGDATYEVRKLESGNILVKAIQDACAPRAGELSREFEPAGK